MIKTKIIYGCESTGSQHEPYMTRITLFEKPWGQLCFHIIHRSDWTRDLHDHPWNFISLVVWRGYHETTEDKETGGYKSKKKLPGMILFRRAEHRHRVELLEEKTAITLVFMFKIKRTWGFWTKDGFVNFAKYFKLKGC